MQHAWPFCVSRRQTFKYLMCRCWNSEASTQQAGPDEVVIFVTTFQRAVLWSPGCFTDPATHHWDIQWHQLLLIVNMIHVASSKMERPCFLGVVCRMFSWHLLKCFWRSEILFRTHWAKRDLRPTRAHLLLLTDDVEALEEKLKETLHKFNAHHARLKCYQMLMSFCFLHLLVPATWSTCRVYQQFLSDLVWGDGHRFAAVDLPQALGTIMKWYGAGYWFLIHRHFEMNLLQVPQINTALPAQNWFQWSMFQKIHQHPPAWIGLERRKLKARLTILLH